MLNRKEIENEILEIKKIIAQERTYLLPGNESQENKDKLEILEKQLQFMPK